MQAGVSNQVVPVLGIYERKRARLLLEINEKPELPNNVIVRNFHGQTNIATIVFSTRWKESPRNGV